MKIKANSPATGKDGLDKQNTNKKSEQLDAFLLFWEYCYWFRLCPNITAFEKEIYYCL
jgi:hypothetical protein